METKLTAEQVVEMIKLYSERPDLSAVDIAKQFNLSRQRLYQIIAQLRKYGAQIPDRRSLRRVNLETVARALPQFEPPKV